MPIIVGFINELIFCFQLIVPVFKSTEKKLFLLFEKKIESPFIIKSEVLKSINTLRNEKTIIMVTHRINNLREFDKIFFMEDGKVIKSGGYNELSKEGILS